MPSVIPYKDGYRAVVRKPGHKTRTKVFGKGEHAEAVKWGRGIEAEMEARTYVPPSGWRAKKVFEKFRDEVCPTRKGCKWETVRINRFLRTIPWMVKPIESVDRFDIQWFRDNRMKEVSDASVNREMNLISGVIRYAMKEWGVALRVNPCHEVARPPKTPPRLRRVAKGEQIKVEAVFDITKVPRKGYGAVKDSIPWVFLLALETGARMSEIINLVWRDVHVDEAWFHISDSKNGDARNVPMTERAEALFRALRDDDAEMVFPISVGSFGTQYRRWCSDNGIVDLHFHDTRHEAASRLAIKLDPRDHAKMLGHRDMNTTLNVYYNPKPDELVKKLRGDLGASAPAPRRDTDSSDATS